jgi:hypothetical protein
MKDIPSFKTELERQRWFIDNADYFTAITRRKMRYVRTEHPTLAEAEAHAKGALNTDPAIRSFLIYAVVNVSDTFVKTIIKDEHGNQNPVNNNNG